MPANSHHMINSRVQEATGALSILYSLGHDAFKNRLLATRMVHFAEDDVI
jgi:hypothetical protein